MDANTQTLLIVFVGLTGAAVLLQAFVLLGIFISLRKAAKSALQATEDLKATVLPMVHTTRELLDRIGPQVVTVSADVAELTRLFRKETTTAKASFSEIMDRLNKQTARLDAMLTSGLNSVERAGSLLESAVAVPVRQVTGIFNAFKAVVETYRSETPRRRQANGQEDRDLFI
jgi:biopolymer transport protein ExbB/TolQ